MCCLPTGAQGSSAAVTRVVGYSVFLGILGAPWSLVHIYRARVTEVCPSLDTPFGGGLWWHYLRDPREFTGVHKSAPYVFRGVEVIPL